ncbi:MAG: GNAT family N-acetyltransferase [Verrucomicrobiota bacterium]
MTTKASALSIEAFEFEDHPKLTKLHEQFYSVTRDEAFWKWKYLERPGGRNSIAIAKDGKGAIVGQTGVSNYPFTIEGKERSGGQAQDIVVLDEYRGGRSFFKLERLARDMLTAEGTEMSYGFSIEITRKVATKALGFTDIGQIIKMVQVYNPAPYIAQKLKIPGLSKVLGAVIRPLLKIKNKRAPKIDLGPDIKIEEVTSFDERFDTLWNAEKDRYGVISNRDSQYLNWRYANNPVQEFTALAAVRGGEILGYIIFEKKSGFRSFSTLSVQVNAATRGEILDFFVSQSEDVRSEDILKRLFREAQDILIEKKVEIISVWCLPHMRMYGMLSKLGFKERPTPHNLIVRKHSEGSEMDRIFDLKSWYLTHGDKDHF